MKRGLPVVAIFLVVAAALYFILHRPAGLEAPPGQSSPTLAHTPQAENPSSPSTNPQAAPTIPGPIPGGTVPSNLADRAGVVTPTSTVVPTLPAAVVVDTVSHAIHDYSAMFGGNPVGTNPEITSALNGNNPKHLNFIKPEAGMRINDQGELVDSWGTPFFFHQLSAHEMEVRSAGMDKIMWTADDLVAR